MLASAVKGNQEVRIGQVLEESPSYPAFQIRHAVEEILRNGSLIRDAQIHSAVREVPDWIFSAMACF
jgi:hypothetical protein